MQQRYYDPQVGRFLSADPANSTFNFYAYANNSPFRFADPDGRRGVIAVQKDGNYVCNWNARDCYPDKDTQEKDKLASNSKLASDELPKGSNEVDSVRHPRPGVTVTSFRPRPITDTETRKIFEIAFNKTDRPIDEQGRELALDMVYEAERTAGPIRQVGAAGITGVPKFIFTLVSVLFQTPRGELNYVERFSDTGQAAIASTATYYQYDYNFWLGGNEWMR